MKYFCLLMVVWCIFFTIWDATTGDYITAIVMAVLGFMNYSSYLGVVQFQKDKDNK